ncbi:MAG: DNA polymerase III subunit alpha [bacterium]
MNNPFIHLHLHSEYSMVDSTIRIPQLVKAARQQGMGALALTDQNNLFAAIKFYKACEKEGIKPIIGADLWLEVDEEIYEMVFLVMDRTGYTNLSHLISEAYLHNQKLGKPRITEQWVKQYQQGLIAICPALTGDISQLILRGHPKAAQQKLEFWQSVFGNRFYLEVTRTGKAEEEDWLYAAAELAAQNHCGLIASNNVRFIDPEGFSAHEARVCIHDGRVLDDPNRPKLYTEQQFFRSPEQMQELFSDLPIALSNTVELAKRCNLELEFGAYFLPDFPVPDGMTVDTFLRYESEQGLLKRIEKLGICSRYTEQDYQDRLKLELDVIINMGFPGYFLIVADFIRWGKGQNIPVGPGRGSGAGSLVAYALEITDLDPLQYDLLFERFLNPERVSMPDFDVDFCMDRRDEVIDYVARQYGRDKVSQIITYGSMAAKAVIRDCGRVLGHPYGLVDGVAKLIPMDVGIKLEDALKKEPQLLELYDTDEEVQGLIDLSLQLEGLKRNAGKHAGGVVISPTPLPDFSPVYCNEDGEDVVTQFDKKDVETAGLVKFDFLGLKTLTIIQWALDTINKGRMNNGEEKLDIAKIPLDDPATYRLLQACDTTGVFQLESRGMKDLIRRLQPDSFDDIIALVALFRPGPLESGMVGTYVECKHGRQKVKYPHADLEEVLKSTYGVILYQEQVMQSAQVLSGFSLGGADILRRAMGKKDLEEMAKQRKVFVDGASARGIDENTSNGIFDLIEKFAGYGFNKSHSAAYALVAYQTAYLKTHYPAEFMAATMTADMDHTEKVVIAIEDVRNSGVEVIPPDINCSFYNFTVDDSRKVIYGLGAIKGVGEGPVESLVNARTNNGQFKDLYDFCSRVDLRKVNRRVLEALVISGAMDSFGLSRSSLFEGLDDAIKAAEQLKRDEEAGQVDLFGSPAPVVSPQMQQLKEWDDSRRLKGEKSTLGLYLTGHPYDSYREQLSRYVTCDLKGLTKFCGPFPEPPEEGQYRKRVEIPVFISGLVSGMRVSERMMALTMDDGTGRTEALFFGKVLTKYRDQLASDQVLIIGGNATPDEFSGGWAVRAEQVIIPDQAPWFFAILLEITLNHAKPATVTRIKEILEPAVTPLGIPVRVYLKSNDYTARFLLPEEWLVKPTKELLSSLQQIQGVEGIAPLFQKKEKD